MRRTIGKRLSNPNNIPSSFSPFSTSSGRGRGGGGPARKINFIGQPLHSDEPSDQTRPEQSVQSGLGRGRGSSGKTLPSTPFLPSFNPNLRSESQRDDPNAPKKPIFFSKVDVTEEEEKKPSLKKIGDFGGNFREEMPLSIMSVLSMNGGAGRGKPGAKSMPSSIGQPELKEDNRHFRPPRQSQSGPGPERGRGKERDQPVVEVKDRPKFNKEDARKRALGVLSRGGGGGDGIDEVGGSGGRGGRGPGRGRGQGRGRGPRVGGKGGGGRGRERLVSRDEDEDDENDGCYLGDDADGEKFASKVGPEVMNQLSQAFEEMSLRVLPSPAMDCYIDALDSNLAIECEPEYLMADFASNPDIDETPIMPLRDALEKLKPLLVAYEGIQSQEEWEEIVDETMASVPLLEEIVNHYSGPDRVTAKVQNKELERVAKMLPQSSPASVHQYTSRALLSLQSNAGWGFDKKCQLMDKLVFEVSQQYK